MKGRPLRDGDAALGAGAPAGQPASMKGRPLRGGDPESIMVGLAEAAAVPR